MDTPTLSPPETTRCPRCRALAEIRPGFRCSECGKFSSRWKWQSFSLRNPVQPEECEGGRCRKCGETVEVLTVDLQKPSHVWGISGIGIMAMWATIVWTFPRPPGIWPVISILSVGGLISGVVLRLHQRHGGPALARSPVVVCPGCGYVRVGDREGADVSSRFWRGRAVFHRLWWWSAALTGFCTVVVAGHFVTGRPPSVATRLYLGLAVVLWILAEVARRPWRKGHLRG